MYVKTREKKSDIAEYKSNDSLMGYCLHEKLSRREFVGFSALITASLFFSGCLGSDKRKTVPEVSIPVLSEKAPDSEKIPPSTETDTPAYTLNLREAEYYDPYSEKNVRCRLCPNKCVISQGNRGLCRVRENKDGKLYAMSYAKVCALHIDPIEKKPFFHYKPGGRAYSIATAGCCLRCKYCQNWQISQFPPEKLNYKYLPPTQVVNEAKKHYTPIIAYTYSEPVVFYEFMKDTAIIARQNNIDNVVITSGYINPEPLSELCRYIDAIKVDLKGFSREFYRKICGGELENVLEAMRVIKENKIWLEIVNLVIPTLNEGRTEFKKMADWIMDNLGPDVPVHFSRFHPDYKLRNLPATPIKTLEKAIKIADDTGLKYVYIGNVAGHKRETTYCPKCKTALIIRSGYSVKLNMKKNLCPVCGYKISGVF